MSNGIQTTDPNNIWDVLKQKQYAGEFGGLGAYTSPEIGQATEQNILGMLTGSAYAPFKAASDQAFATQMQNIKAQTGGRFAPHIGQGMGTKANQMVQQNVLTALAEKGLGEAGAAQKMKTEGIGQAMQLAQVGQAGKQMEMGYMKMASDEKLAKDKLWLEQQGIDLEQAKIFGYTDPVTGEHVMGSYDLQKLGIDMEHAKLFGYDDPVTGEHIMGTIEMQSNMFQTQMNSQAGQAFSSYLMSNLEAGIDDPAVKNLGQALWESLGNEGEVPDAWLEARIAAVRDPKLTNGIVAMSYQLDQAVKTGDLTQEQADDIMAGIIDMITGGGPDEDVDIDDWKDLTDKQAFEKFMAEHIPPKYMDMIDYDDWIAAGSPHSWQEYLDTLDEEGGPVDTGSDDLDLTKPIADSSGNLLMDNKSIINIINRIKQGFAPANKYLADKSLENSIGKVTELEDGRYVVITGYWKPRPKKGSPTARLGIVAYDPQTGETENISIYD